MYQNVLIFAFVAVCVGRPQTSIDSYVNRVSTTDYEFSYKSSDGTERHESGILINDGTPEQDFVVKGSTSWTAPNGVMYVLEFVSDKMGYRPSIRMGALSKSKLPSLRPGNSFGVSEYSTSRTQSSTSSPGKVFGVDEYSTAGTELSTSTPGKVFEVSANSTSETQSSTSTPGKVFEVGENSTTGTESSTTTPDKLLAVVEGTSTENTMKGSLPEGGESEKVGDGAIAALLGLKVPKR